MSPTQTLSEIDVRASPSSSTSTTPNANLRTNRTPTRTPTPNTSDIPKFDKSLCNCDEMMSIDCHLETKDLWDKFFELGTEMIITKTGRLVTRCYVVFEV